MSQTIRVIVVNTDEEVASDLRSVLLSIDGVRIVAEIDEPAMLGRALDQFPAEVVLVHLDPNPSNVMDLVAPLIEVRKGSLTAIAMTEERDAELVVRAMRAGMREFLWKPFPPEQLAEILHRAAVEAIEGGRKLGRLVAVVGSCGGVGTTCLATNLAVELSQIEAWSAKPAADSKPRVLLVDLDFRFGQVAMQLDCQPTYTIAELCDTAEALDPQMIQRAVCKHETGVHILARPAEFGAQERISAGQCAGALAALQEYYDFVVVDAATRFDPSAKAVFDMSDTYMLVMQLSVPSVRNADRVLQQLAATGYSQDRIRLVCSRYSRDSGHLEPGDVETTLRRKLDFTIVEDVKTSGGAVNMGSPLLLHAPKSKLRACYRQIAMSLVGAGEGRDDEEPAAAGGGKKGLLSIFAGSR